MMVEEAQKKPRTETDGGGNIVRGGERVDKDLKKKTRGYPLEIVNDVILFPLYADKRSRAVSLIFM